MLACLRRKGAAESSLLATRSQTALLIQMGGRSSCAAWRIRWTAASTASTHMRPRWQGLVQTASGWLQEMCPGRCSPTARLLFMFPRTDVGSCISLHSPVHKEVCHDSLGFVHQSQCLVHLIAHKYTEELKSAKGHRM